MDSTDYIYFVDAALFSDELTVDIVQTQSPAYSCLLTLKAYRTPEFYEDGEIHEVHEKAELLFTADGYLFLTDLLKKEKKGARVGSIYGENYCVDFDLLLSELVKNHAIDDYHNIFLIDSLHFAEDAPKDQISDVLFQLLYFTRIDLVDGDTLDKIYPYAKDEDERRELVPNIFVYCTEDKAERDLFLAAGWRECENHILCYIARETDEY